MDDDKYWAPCPDCSGSGAEGEEDEQESGPCVPCDGNGERYVHADEIVRVRCLECQGEGATGGVLTRDGWVYDVCEACKGEGEFVGPAEEVCGGR